MDGGCVRLFAVLWLRRGSSDPVLSDGVTMKKIVPVRYPTKEEKLAHLVRLTADKLSETNKSPRMRRVLVNQLQFFRRFWERNKGDE